MAREIGYYAPELIERCAIDRDPIDGIESVCKARILGVWVDTASFSMYVKSLAVAVQALCIISIGPLADSPYWRKRLLLTFAYTGSLSAILFLFFPSAPYTWTPVLAALLNVVGNASYSTSIVCSNAFLPLLAREDQHVVQAWEELQRSRETSGASDDDQDSAPLGREDEGEADGFLTDSLGPAVQAISIQDLANDDPGHKPTLPADSDLTNTYHTLLSLTTSRLSSTGTAIGFLSGVSILTLLLIPVLALNGSTFSLRLAIGLSGIWWALFTISSWLGLPGGSEGDGRASSTGGMRRMIREAWTKLGAMVRPAQIRQLPDLYLFLMAWAFLSDGFHTTTYAAILFASSVLNMSPAKIILVGILVQFSAVISSILTPHIQRRLSARSEAKPMTNFQVLLWGVLAGSAIPVYACAGLILPFGGLRSEMEMYVLAIWFGLLFGPFLSYSRAVYAELIPPGHESTFFSLFAFTDKSASFIGPAAVGLISDLTGNLRYGFIFLLIMLTAPLPILLRVNVEQGRAQARAWAASRLVETRDQGSLGIGTPLEDSEREELLPSS